MRAPLTPAHVKELKRLKDVQVTVQPCSKRIFTDKEYEKVGAKVKEDLRECDIIVGVKEIPPARIIPGKAHICFSHTHKGQPAGQPTLTAFMERRASLLDYELLVDEEGKRQVAFGKYAGYSGMVNCLHGLGDRFLQLGYRTPFLNIGLAHTYPTLVAAKGAVEAVGRALKTQGLPDALKPITFVFSGKGNVYQGAIEIFNLLKPKHVKPVDFVAAVGKAKDELLCTTVEYSDFTQGKESVFAQKFGPHTTVLVNGIFWNAGLPRILSKSDLATLSREGKTKMVAIADISCDINGGVEATSHATSIDAPFFYYNPVSGKEGSVATGPEDIQLMTIDNLPAQLPKDASGHFSDSLLAVMKAWIKGIKAGEIPKIVSDAAIVQEGKLVKRFGNLRAASGTPTVLVLGSGYVSKPTVDYLANQKGYRVIVASNSEAEGKRIIAGCPNARIEPLDAGNKEQVRSLIQGSNAVISLLPAGMHPEIAEQCIALKKDMVTGSYISPRMKELHGKAQSAGITILNEIGLDPGLDHLSAMKMIDGVKSQGDRITSFVSWCGGLPAPECTDNPFGYKFSWRPQGVLAATQNPARYLLNGRTVEVQGKDLLRAAMPIKIHGAFAFEGIPNRDSLGYIDTYGLQGVQTMFRGTLRYRGFAELMDSCTRLGLLSTAPLSPVLSTKKNWLDVMEALVTNSNGSGTLEKYAKALGSPSMTAKAGRVIAALEWLGALSASEPFKAGPSMLDSFAGLLEKKLVYGPGERDMAFMFHELQVQSPSGRKGKLTSTLIQYGIPGGYSAMAKTVGLPVAVAADLLLHHRVPQKGVIAPLHRDIYDPMLDILAGQGISFTDTHQQ